MALQSRQCPQGYQMVNGVCQQGGQPGVGCYAACQQYHPSSCDCWSCSCCHQYHHQYWDPAGNQGTGEIVIETSCECGSCWMQWQQCIHGCMGGGNIGAGGIPDYGGGGGRGRWAGGGRIRRSKGKTRNSHRNGGQIKAISNTPPGILEEPECCSQGAGHVIVNCQGGVQVGLTNYCNSGAQPPATTGCGGVGQNSTHHMMCVCAVDCLVSPSGWDPSVGYHGGPRGSSWSGWPGQYMPGGDECPDPPCGGRGGWGSGGS